MKLFHDLNSPEVASILISGGIGILRTDTIYGVIGSADNKAAVERIYKLKDRDDGKSPIVLISSLSQLFDAPSDEVKSHLDAYWPGKVSIIMPSERSPDWIERGNHSVAYRMPDDVALCALIEKTGPLIAPSANPQGEVPALTIDHAVSYFAKQVDFYVDGGEVTDNTPSQLIRINERGEVERLR